jgi:holo-[acyl-carrier protein] synthase
MRRGSADPQGGPGPDAVPEPGTDAAAPPMTELGIDIIKVSRIRDTLERFGERFNRRVLTDAERRYVRNRPETFAGRWAAKEAVSKVLGLGVRGIGWRDIEIERLPTGQPAVRLHGRAAARAVQLGMGRIAVSITHESDYAVAIAYGTRTAGGRFDDRERLLLARFERLRSLHEANGALESALPEAARAALGRERGGGAGASDTEPDPAMVDDEQRDEDGRG